MWPENAETLMVFLSMRTQWTVGVGGIMGMRYEAMESVMRLRGVARKDKAQVFADVQAMEYAALDTWAKKKQPAD